MSPIRLWRQTVYKSPRSRVRNGRRADLGNQYFRGNWEANYARYLNWLKNRGLIHDWKYEAQRFEFPLQRARTYLPDFKIWEKPDSTPYFVEIKGWMKKQDQTQLARMAKYYPEVRLVVISKKDYNALRRKIRGFIKNWEE